jgi:hypothetical protein
MEDWAAISREVADAIGSVGGQVLLVRAGAMTGPAYNPTIGPDQTFPVTIVQTGTNSITRQPGYVVQAGEKVGMMAAGGVVPLPTDKLRIAGVDHTIKAIMPLQPDPMGAVVMYDYVAVR